MHLFFSVAREHRGPPDDRSAHESPVDAGQILVARDPEDESEWQYLGNPEIALRTSLKDVVTRFVDDCRDADGAIRPGSIAAARHLHTALLLAAKQIDDALGLSTAK